MLRVMVSPAEPAHLKRLAVVVVVHLLARFAALLTRLALQLASPQTGVGVAARIGPPERLTLERMSLSPLAHVGRMAGSAVALPRPVALAATLDACS